jgi:hypothetical protein
MYKRLTKWIDGEAKENHDFDSPVGTSKEQRFTNGSRACLEKLAAFEDAEEAGLLVRLPCRVGSVVYLASGKGVSAWNVSDIELFPDSSCVVNVLNKEHEHIMNIFEDFRFGKSVFRSRAEAEKALERVE